jgi:hypothetical protein
MHRAKTPEIFPQSVEIRSGLCMPAGAPPGVELGLKVAEVSGQFLVQI